MSSNRKISILNINAKTGKAEKIKKYWNFAFFCRLSYLQLFKFIIFTLFCKATREPSA
jgi:hypothetical protein